MAQDIEAYRLSDYVNTLRGSNSDHTYSKGNTFPAAAVPFGFNFWSPMTDANSERWIYQYNKQKIEAFTVTHIPSPWIGDRQTLQFMPMSGEIIVDRAARGAAFTHAKENAKAHVYSVSFDNGIRTEIAPSNHAACLRFTFSSASSYLLFDTVNHIPGSIFIDQEEGVISGYTDHPDGFLKQVPRMYFYASFCKPIADADLVEGYRDVTSWIKFDTSQDRTVEMKLATSFISVDQAKANLLQEIGNKSLDEVRKEAQDEWDKLLGKIEVEGASVDQDGIGGSA